MKFKITKAEFEKLDPSMQALYKAGDGDNYVMNVEGMPQAEDVTGLKNKVAELLTEKKKSDEEKVAADLAAKTAADELARKNGDVAALDKSWGEKLAAVEAKYQGEIASRDSSINAVMVDSKALELANKLGGENAALLLPHIKSRLACENVDGKYQTRVLDATGKPSSATLDELATEFTGNPMFKSAIITTQAAGTGGAGKPNQGTPAGGAGGGKENNGDDRTSRAAEIIANMPQ